MPFNVEKTIEQVGRVSQSMMAFVWFACDWNYLDFIISKFNFFEETCRYTKQRLSRRENQKKNILV